MPMIVNDPYLLTKHLISIYMKQTLRFSNFLYFNDECRLFVNLLCNALPNQLKY